MTKGRLLEEKLEKRIIESQERAEKDRLCATGNMDNLQHVHLATRANSNMFL